MTPLPEYGSMIYFLSQAAVTDWEEIQKYSDRENMRHKKMKHKITRSSLLQNNTPPRLFDLPQSLK